MTNITITIHSTKFTKNTVDNMAAKSALLNAETYESLKGVSSLTQSSRMELFEAPARVKEVAHSWSLL